MTQQCYFWVCTRKNRRQRSETFAHPCAQRCHSWQLRDGSSHGSVPGEADKQHVV